MNRPVVDSCAAIAGLFPVSVYGIAMKRFSDRYRVPQIVFVRYCRSRGRAVDLAPASTPRAAKSSGRVEFTVRQERPRSPCRGIKEVP